MSDRSLATPTVFTLRASGSVVVRVTNLGATLMAIETPDRTGRLANILLGYDTPSDYPAAGGVGTDAYFGATCGRFANRIAGAAFRLDGVDYRLSANEGANHLHGGATNFHHAVWHPALVEDQRLVLTHRSPDGDQGYPGALDVVADFALRDATDGAAELAIVYTATTSRPTHVNLASHGYFNLSGDPNTPILDHRLWIDATEMLPINAANLPTGARVALAGSPFDFSVSRPIGQGIDADDAQLRYGSGYNHTYVLAGSGVRPVARLHHPLSSRTLTLTTDQPGLQLYTGNHLDGAFVARTGVCLEAQNWPDSPNQPGFPSTRLDPGETYRSETRLRFALD